MATKLHQIFAGALLGGAMCVAGPSFAANTTVTHESTVHHQATTTTLKHKTAAVKTTDAQIESKERSTTADLNRASLARAAQGQTSLNEQADTMQQATLDEEEDILLTQQAMLENDDGTAVD